MYSIAAVTYVDISREEFEDWLDSLRMPGGHRWRLKPGTKGVYIVPLSENVGIEVSSSLTGTGDTVGYANASMQLRLASLITGQTLNKKAQEQSHFKRTKGWRKSLTEGVERMKDAYLKAASFYEAIAEIQDREAYRRDMLAKIEDIPGWQSNTFLSDLHQKVDTGGVLTIKQRDAIQSVADKSPLRPTRSTPPTVDELRALYLAARWTKDTSAMEIAQMVGEMLKSRRMPAENQRREIDRLLAKYDRDIQNILKEWASKRASEVWGMWRVASQYSSLHTPDP